MHVWFNGRLLPDARDAALSVLDHGLTVGDGVFESVKVLHGHPFALTRHLDRLARSAAAMGLPEPDAEVVREGVASTIEAETTSPALGRLRITYTAGNAPMGSHRGDDVPTCIVVYGPVDPIAATTSVVTVPWVRNERGAMAGIKSTSYAENVLALAHAQSLGATEALFGNTRGQLCEGTGSNVFYVVDGELRTPTLASGCLAGVTRALVIEWAADTESPVREVDEDLAVLQRADEVFLTSSFRDVQGVARCDDRVLAAPGPVTERLRALWAEREAQALDP